MKKYDKYKNSGIDWLEEIPEHWKVAKIKHVLSNLNSRRIPLSSVERADMKERQYDYYGASGVIDKVDNYLFDEETILIGEDGANLLSRSKRLAFIASGKYWVNNHAHILKPIEGNIRYFAELLETIDYTPLIVGAAQPKLTQEALMNIEVIEPPVDEQTKIASYLDHKTTQIDTLIEKKEQLIEKLKLQRQTIINEAVTKGLNPDTPMKDSGIEWLGEIPDHWEVNYIKRGLELLTDYEANGSFDSIKKNVEFTDDAGFAWYVRATDLENSLFLNENHVRWVDEKSYQFLEKTKLYGEELLVAKRGEIGKVYLMPKVETKATLAPNLYLVRLNDKLDSEFAWYYFESEIGKGQLKLKNRSTTMGALYKDDFKEISIVFPSIQEQIDIRNELDIKYKKITKIIDKVELSIEKLKLYRQSIISEAVTGKIDVRDWVKPENNI